MTTTTPRTQHTDSVQVWQESRLVSRSLTPIRFGCAGFLQEMMMNEVRLGDYVLASNSKAGDSGERWTCGIVVAIGEEEVVRTGKITRYIKLENSEVLWRYWATITPELAEDLPGMIKFNPTGRSIWQMRRELMSTGRSDPTPEEIWNVRTKAIQAEWTEAERLAHVVGPDYRLPVMQVVPVRTDRRTMDIEFNH